MTAMLCWAIRRLAQEESVACQTTAAQRPRRRISRISAPRRVLLARCISVRSPSACLTLEQIKARHEKSLAHLLGQHRVTVLYARGPGAGAVPAATVTFFKIN